MEEGGQEREIEIVTDSEMEQPTSDKKETEVVTDREKEIVEEDAQGDQPDKAVAREEPNWQEIMKFMAKQFRKQEENSKQKFDKIDENLRKQEGRTQGSKTKP